MRTLGIIALAGIATSFTCLALAHVIDPNVYSMQHAFVFGRNCSDSSTDSTEATDIAWDGDSAVTINVPATVHYHPHPDMKVHISGPSGVVRHLRVHDGNIEADCNLSGISGLDIVLPGRAFDTFTLNGAGRLLLENIDQSRLDVILRGFGDVQASGRADALELNISGAGNADLGKLVSRSSKVRIAGAGKAQLDATENADISISGAGEIRFIEQPRNLQTHIRGAGRIINAPPKSPTQDL